MILPLALALIDGEHYPPVVVDALRELRSRYQLRAAVFLGGTEKTRSVGSPEEDEELYGLPLVRDADPVRALHRAIDVYRPELVVDLSDDPVLPYPARFRLICHTLARNVAYEGSDFRFKPPRLDRLALSPSLSIIGTAKRVGKTALSGYVARMLQDLLGRSEDAAQVVIVPMGRGGPARPEIIDGIGRELGASELLEWSRAGRHAASDHFEDAVLSRVTTVGCRRCGGGLAGEPFVSNVAEGALLANSLNPAFVVFEGSGAAIPPVATDARLLVAGAHQPIQHLTGYLGLYRLLVSDAVVLTMAEEPFAGPDEVERISREIAAVKPGIPVIPVVFRPRPAGDVQGRKVAFFSTAPPSQEATLRSYLEERWGARVVLFSGNLSRRGELERDLSRAEMARAEVVLTEIKAAAVEVVAEEAERRSLPIVFVDNEAQERGPARPGDLEQLCRDLTDLALERFNEAR